tara:strand:- start:2459 stop:3034 length:576 start_codon:yes stop_codon:yes gene_type:complete
MENENTRLIDKWFKIITVIAFLSAMFVYFIPQDTEDSKSLQAAQRSLHASHILYTPDQLLDEWVRLGSEDTYWYEELPKCPVEIAITNGENGQTLVIHPDPEVWGPVSRAGMLHGKAIYAVRSKPIQNSSSQCTYDKDGKLYSSKIPEAGTSDFYSPSISKYLHYIYDVEPYILARDLNRVSDYYNVRPPK